MQLNTDLFHELIVFSKVSTQEGDNIFVVKDELLAVFYDLYHIDHEKMLKYPYLKEFIENHIIDSVEEGKVVMVSGEIFDYILDTSVDGIPIEMDYVEDDIRYIILDGVLLPNEEKLKKYADSFLKQPRKMKSRKTINPNIPKMNNQLEELNNNYKLADTLPLDVLGRILKDSEIAYYNETDEPLAMLDDKVYNYAKEIYRVRSLEAGKPVDEDPMEHVPQPVGRLVKAPVWMGGIDKVNKGSGKLHIWQGKYPGPYVVSGKMDGASSLYFYEGGQYKLYSRGRGGKSQDISELLPFLMLPALDKGQFSPNYLIRGELILRKSVFDTKYKKTGEGNEPGKYMNARNAVSGLVNRVGSRAAGSKSSSGPLDVSFVHDLEFVAYEVIANPPLKCSTQFEILEKISSSLDQTQTGFRVAIHQIVMAIDDEILSSIYHEYMADVDYEMDGVVVCSDHVYERPSGKNPPHMVAFKEELDVLTGTTVVKYIEWKVSKDGYIKPTIVYEPLPLGGVINTRATVYNAKFVVDNKIGPGALVEITRAGGINPKVINVIEPAREPQLPEIDYQWNSTKVDFILPEEVGEETRREMIIKKLYFFLSSIGTKGVGETTVAKMYDGGIVSIPQFFTLKKSDIEYLGPKNSENIAKMIYEKTRDIPITLLMSASGVFGRGLGEKTFLLIFEAYPEFMQLVRGLIGEEGFSDEDADDLVKLLLDVKGIGEKTAVQIVNGLPVFLEFLKELEKRGYKQRDYVVPVRKEVSGNHPLKGKNILLTGFRDENIVKFIEKVGGIVQKDRLSNSTNMLIIKNDSYENTKTAEAKARGLEIMTRQDFVEKYFG